MLPVVAATAATRTRCHLAVLLSLIRQMVFGVTLLAFLGLVAVGLGLTEHIDAMADSDVPSKGFDFDREQGA
jgi:hypothetical protein